MVPEISMHADRQTDRHASHNTQLLYWWQSNKNTEYVIYTYTVSIKKNDATQPPTTIGPIPWGHRGPHCHALSLLWTSHAACAIAIAGMRLATPDD